MTDTNNISIIRCEGTTKNLQEILWRSQQLARRNGSYVITPQNLLYQLSDLEGCTATRAFMFMNISSLNIAQTRREFAIDSTTEPYLWWLPEDLTIIFPEWKDLPEEERTQVFARGKTLAIEVKPASENEIPSVSSFQDWKDIKELVKMLTSVMIYSVRKKVKNVSKGLRKRLGKILISEDLPPVYYSREARELFELAEEEARRLGHGIIGTEHLLLAFTGFGAGKNANAKETEASEPENPGSLLLFRVAQQLKSPLSLADVRKNIFQQVIRKGHRGGYRDAKRLANAAPYKELDKELQNVDYFTSTYLEKFGTNLTVEATNNKLDPVIGRDSELKQVTQVLSRFGKNSPVLLGEAGVGKTAIVEGLALKIVSDDVPWAIQRKPIMSLNVGSITAGTKYRGWFEARMKRMIRDLKKRGAILFIDELHLIMGAGGVESSNIDISNLLKPALGRGEFRFIGATTLVEYQKFIASDRAMARRFQPVYVSEPTVEETIEIIRGMRGTLERYHHINVDSKAIDLACKLSVQYIPDRFLPDKAIDLIDEACSRLAMENLKPRHLLTPKSLREIKKIGYKIESAMRDQCSEALITARQERLERRLGQNMDLIRNRFKDGKVDGEETVARLTTVGTDEIASIVSEYSSVPVEKLTETETLKIQNLERELAGRVVGQEKAVLAVCGAIRRSRAGLKDSSKPIASFMFAGPTGTGKTQLAKTLADFYYGSMKSLIRVDMSELQESHSITKLIGVAPGYAGSEDSSGTLVYNVRNNPYSLILFDEVEKAHPRVMDIMLQMFDDGRLTDNSGKTTDFKNTLIILTTNEGARTLIEDVRKLSGQKKSEIFETTSTDDTSTKTSEGNGLYKPLELYDKLRDKVYSACRKKFRAEFMNRLDDFIVFQPLKMDDIIKIAKIELEGLQEQVESTGLTVTFEPEVIRLLAEKGYEPLFGARPLRRVINLLVEVPICELLLDGKVGSEDSLKIEVGIGRQLIANNISANTKMKLESDYLNRSKVPRPKPRYRFYKQVEPEFFFAFFGDSDDSGEEKENSAPNY